MKKPTLKLLAAQREANFMLSSPARIRIINQLLATPFLTMTAIAKRTGLSGGNVHTALKDLMGRGAIKMNKDKTYYMNEGTLDMIANLLEDSAELQFALNKFRAKAPRKNTAPPQLRAIL